MGPVRSKLSLIQSYKKRRWWRAKKREREQKIIQLLRLDSLRIDPRGSECVSQSDYTHFSASSQGITACVRVTLFLLSSLSLFRRGST